MVTSSVILSAKALPMPLMSPRRSSSTSLSSGSVRLSRVGRLYTDCFTSLRQRGRPIPTNDIWIAACCQFVGGTLLTADQHFLSVNRLAVEFVGEAD